MIFLIACFSIIGLLAVLLRRAEALARFCERAAFRLDRGRAVPILWGLAAALLDFILALVLFQIHVLHVLGVLVLIAGVSLASLGMAVAALSLGQRLAEAMGTLDTEIQPALRLGFWSLLLASFVPFAGWMLALLALASGIGAVLETFVTRSASDQSE